MKQERPSRQGDAAGQRRPALLRKCGMIKTQHISKGGNSPMANVVKKHSISSELEQKLVNAAVAKARELGVSENVAILDDGGNLKASPLAVVTRPCGAGLRPPAAGVAGDGPHGAGRVLAGCWDAPAGGRPGGTTPGGRTRPGEKAV